MSKDTKFAHLGKPGSAFSKGFARRLVLLQRYVDLRGAKILDVGCGEGVWSVKFLEFTPAANVYGCDFDAANIERLKVENNQIARENFVACPAEALVWSDNFFDVVFSNEVLEHVQDDQKSVAEAIRVLKSGGKFVFFTPNRGWPFETHGIFWRGKYVWGNIPLLPWLPKSLYKKFAPHVRNYTNSDIHNLLRGLPAKIIVHTHVFPGFDGLERKFGFLGRLVKGFFHVLEKTPLHWFGISHFVVVEKV